jgi:predicted component of type VI protein secretion system
MGKRVSKSHRVAIWIETLNLAHFGTFFAVSQEALPISQGVSFFLILRKLSACEDTFS